MKGLALSAAAGVGALAAALVLWNFRAVAMLFVLSLAVAAALRPLVNRPLRWGWPGWLAQGTAYLLVLSLVGAVIGLAAGPVLDDVGALADSFTLAYEHAWSTWPEEGTAAQQAVAAWLPPPPDLYAALAGPAGVSLRRSLLGVTLNVFDWLGSAALVLMLSVYWGADQARTERLWLSVLPAESRARARGLWRSIEHGVGSYLRSEVVQSLLAGVLLGLGYWALGLHYPALLAVLTALAWLIPWLGAVLALVPVLLVASTQGAGLMVLAGLYTLLIFGLLEFGVEPRIYGRRQHSSLLVALLLVGLGEGFGLPGVLAAPLVAAAIHISLTHLVAAGETETDATVTARHAALRARLAALRRTLAESAPDAAPQVVSLAERLHRLVDQTGEALRMQ